MAAPEADDRLDSWKEIAAYLKRDASTVRRWEKAGLPVHRHQHKTRAAVYAYRSEIDVWWNNGQAISEAAPDAPRRHHTGVWLAIAGLLVIALVATASWQIAARSNGSASAPLRVVPFTSYAGAFKMPAFSPDGDRIAFSWTGPPGGSWSIYVKGIGEGSPLRLTTSPGEDNAPAWSPDGTKIAFLRWVGNTAAIYEVGALGGPERKLADLAYGRYFNLQWTHDGRSIVFAERTSTQVPVGSLASDAIFLLSVEQQTKRQLTFPSDSETDHRFALSPDGATLAFLRYSEQGVNLSTIPITGGKVRHLFTEHAWSGHVVWAADGRSLIFTSTREGGNKLWRIPLAGGEPEPVPLGEEDVFSPTVAPTRSRLAYVREYFDTDLMRLADITERATGMPFAASARIETAPAYSPDGRSVAYFSEQSGRRELWMSKADGSEPVQVTDFFAWDTLPPSWAPDGRTIAFFSGHGPGGSTAGIFLLDVATRQVRRLTSARDWTMPSWSHDGKSIFITIGEESGHRQVARLPAAGGSPVVLTSPDSFMPRESPDGRNLYYLRNSGGIWRTSEADGQESLAVPAYNPARWSNWAVVPTGIYYVRQDSAFDGWLEFLNFATARTRHVVEIPGDPLEFTGGLTVSPDGRSIIYTRVSRSASDIMLVENFR